MPTFGDFETYGEPLAVTDERGHATTVWQARKAGGDNRLFVIKCFAPRRPSAAPAQAEGDLEKDRALEFLEGIKQIKKAQTEGGRNLAPIHDLGKTATEAWYATDHYPRNNLKAWVARRGGVDSAALRHVLGSVVAGCLSLKRSRGFSHGNLKPSNIFLVGQPRPLKKTPLVLTDAYPAATTQLAALEGTDQAEVRALLGQVVEAEDLRRIGELILQLVEGRLLTRSDDYNYPVQRSSIWDILGKDAEYWLKLCNQLLNPQLSLNTTNLETLATEFRPSQTGRKLAMIIGAVAGVCLVAGVGYFAFSRYQAHRAVVEAQRIQALTEWTNQMTAAATSLDTTNFTEAADKFHAAHEYATRAKATDLAAAAERGSTLAEQLSRARDSLVAMDNPEALRHLESAADGAKSYAACSRWIAAQALPIASRYFASGQPDEADHWVKLAMLVSPPDPAASTLAANIKQAQQNAQNLARLLSAAQKAEQDSNDTNALALYQQANTLKPNDPAVEQKLRDLSARIEQQRQAAAMSARQQQAQADLLGSAQAAEQKADYTNALALYHRLDQLKPGDPQIASKLRELQAKADEQSRLSGNFQATIASARAAEQAGNFTNALALYQRADQMRRGNPEVAAKLREVAPKAADQETKERQRLADLQTALRSAQIAERDHNYTNALGLYQEAKRLAPDDSQIQAKVTELTGKASDQLAQARDAAAKFNAELGLARAAEQAGDWTNALAHYQLAQQWNSHDPQLASKVAELKPKAQQQEQSMAAQLQRAQEGAAAKRLAEAAESTNAWDLALGQWQQVGRLLPQDTSAPAAQAFAEAMTNALGRLALARAQTNTAPSAATNLCVEALQAVANAWYRATNSARIAALQSLTNQVATIQSAALASLSQASLQQDEKSANAAFDHGDYAQAAALCQKHPDQAAFKTLAARVADERAALDKATQAYNQGDYSFLDSLAAKAYRTKPPFLPLVTNGAREAQVWTNLSTLQQATNWPAVRAMLADPGLTNFTGKAGFARYADWASRKAAAEQQDLDLARQALDQCDFAKVQQISSAHASSASFLALVSQADNIKARLGQLTALKSNNDWNGLNAQWTKLDATVQQRSCFADLKKWLDANNPCRGFDAEIAAIKVRLKIVRESPEILDAVAPRPADRNQRAKPDPYVDVEWYRDVCSRISKALADGPCADKHTADFRLINSNLNER